MKYFYLIIIPIILLLSTSVQAVDLPHRHHHHTPRVPMEWCFRFNMDGVEGTSCCLAQAECNRRLEFEKEFTRGSVSYDETCFFRPITRNEIPENE